MSYAGIDLSARRGFDVAVLDEHRRVQDVSKVPSLDDLVGLLAGFGGALSVAIDAPQAHRYHALQDAARRAALGVAPGSYQRYRLCDYELARRGMPLYLLPEPGTAVPAWMEVGFAAFDRLWRDLGLVFPAHSSDVSAGLLEVYPFASFVTLLGGRPPRKMTAAGRAARLRALELAGVSAVPSVAVTHHALDAIVAAYTAWAWHHGQGSAVGDPAEGLIVLPITMDQLKERYPALG